MSNGIGLNIQHVGSTIFHTPMSKSKLLSLYKLLHVPLISKNLISVSQLSRDNNIYFEFYPDLSLVKDQVTKDILMEERLKNGLYAF